MNILIYGAGNNGIFLSNYYKSKHDNVVGFLDQKYEHLQIVNDIMVFSPNELKKIIFDKVVISISDKNSIIQIKNDLLNQGIKEDQIIIYIYDEKLIFDSSINNNSYGETDTRVYWLKSFSNFVYDRNIKGSVAECGVYRGEFAYYINKYFYDRKTYLFDTFEGFDIRDLEIEKNLDDNVFLSGTFNNNYLFNATNEELVLSRMNNKENCVIKKGYFPESAKDLDDIFCFVNLDMDLFNPMYEGLKFFYNRMSKGGVILLHDYFHPELPGVKSAVLKFEKELGEKLNLFPIGDDCSIAVIK